MIDVNTTTAVLGFLGGGAVGAAISSRTNSRIARATRRDKAAETLWHYHYALAGFAASAGGELQDDEVSMLGADWDQIKTTLHAAYPYAGYLTASVRSKLFMLAWIETNSDPDQEWWAGAQDRHDTFTALAALLESDLQWAFPQRFGDRFRGLSGRWRTRTERTQARERLKLARKAVA